MAQADPFLTRIDAVLAGGGLVSLERSTEAGHAAMPADASLQEHPRLIVCLEGTANFLLARDGTAVEVSLPPRGALFVPAGYWVRAQPRQHYVSMGAVFYQHSTRFYLIRAKPGRARPADSAPTAETKVVPQPLGEAGQALCRMPAGAAPSGGAERFFRDAAECLLISARELLAMPESSVTAGKARFTWQAACDYLADNLHRPLSRKDVARYLRVHPNHLSRLFAEHGNEPFAVFLQNLRLDRARLLLTDPRLNVAEVARLSGFGSASYFNRLFRARHRSTPTRMRTR
jgi:AraC-like DNA-binding protein